MEKRARVEQMPSQSQAELWDLLFITGKLEAILENGRHNILYWRSRDGAAAEAASKKETTEFIKVAIDPKPILWRR